MNEPMTENNDWKSRAVRNTLSLGYWTAAWLITLAIATFGPRYIWDSSTVFTVLAILLNLGVGFGMILANKRHLNGLDELQQKLINNQIKVSISKSGRKALFCRDPDSNGIEFIEVSD